MTTTSSYKAPRGTQLSCKGWSQEAALRMLLNNLDPEVAEDPENLIVYGGTGKAARNQACLEAIIESLKKLEDNESLLVQSGKPVGIITTTPESPRVLIANSMLVPAWANWETFREFEKQGLTMYGQMTAGSWIYIGTQGILQGTYETLAELGRQHFNDDLAGTLTLTAGLGGMGGAQPLAVTMNDGVCLIVDVDPERVQRRVDHHYLDVIAKDLDEALELSLAAKAEKRPLSVGLVGNAGTIFPEIFKRNIIPDIVTDQTSAHDMLQGYVPAQYSYSEALELRASNPDQYLLDSFTTVAHHVQAMLDFQQAGSIVFDYGNNIREQAKKAGVANAFNFPGFVPAYIRPLFCEGKGPFRWVALSGDPEDIYVTDQAVLETFPEDKALRRWIEKAQKQVAFQGLPSRICWLGYGERAKLGKVFNQLVQDGKVSAPIVIGRDHLDSGSVASPNRETEGMKDGSDAIGDWPILNAFSNIACGADWVSFHHGGGVGIGYSLHAGMVVVADGSEAAFAKLDRVLTADPAMGVIRHVDAGYERAIEVAKERGVNIPMMNP